jgi:hypothetical protein
VFPNHNKGIALAISMEKIQIAGFGGEELKKHIASSYSYTKHGFDVAMTLMEEESEEALKWLSNIPRECWARYAMDVNCKTDMVVNNLSEVFSKMILDVSERQTCEDNVCRDQK